MKYQHFKIGENIDTANMAVTGIIMIKFKQLY